MRDQVVRMGLALRTWSPPQCQASRTEGPIMQSRRMGAGHKGKIKKFEKKKKINKKKESSKAKEKDKARKRRASATMLLPH